jgi:hypothetical protein
VAQACSYKKRAIFLSRYSDHVKKNGISLHDRSCVSLGEGAIGEKEFHAESAEKKQSGDKFGCEKFCLGVLIQRLREKFTGTSTVPFMVTPPTVRGWKRQIFTARRADWSKTP